MNVNNNKKEGNDFFIKLLKKFYKRLFHQIKRKPNF